MAYVNVKDWTVDQVTDWLKGLDNVIVQYNTSFLNNGVTGHQLLSLRADDLEHLGVKTLGHQEIILEAVEHLRNFHFELDKENLQTLALKLSCASNSLYKELLLVDDDCSLLQTQVMADVHNIITTIKPLVCWLDRSPFLGDKEYIDTKTSLLELGFEMATSAHRGIFSEKPVRTIRSICEKLVKISDHIIQDIMDPMILQPASLDLATLKKKEQELGFFILASNHAIHQIVDIKHGSPAHGSSKIEEGDEIVQVNYQTVVGWQRKKVMMLLQESPPEIVLTLKKRPRHTKVYGQIYMKPYRLPSRKRNAQDWSSRWNENIPSPRLLPMFLPPITITKAPEVSVEITTDVEVEELSSSDSEPPDSPLDGSCRVYPLKPRPILQRRNTITGSTPTNKRPYPSIEQYWDLIKPRGDTTHSSSNAIESSTTQFNEESKFLRDKSASCNVALDISPRPTTVIGISRASSKKEKRSKRKVNFEEKKTELLGSKSNKELGITSSVREPLTPISGEETTPVNTPVKTPRIFHLEPTNLNEEKSVSTTSLVSLQNEEISFIDEGRELTDRSSMTPDLQKNIIEESQDQKSDKDMPAVLKKDPIITDVNVHDIIKKFDENITKPTSKAAPRVVPSKPPEVPSKPDGKPHKIKPAVPPRSATTKLRGKLDKSHSTPAYDLSEEPLETLPMETKPIQPFDDSLNEIGIPIVEAINPILPDLVLVMETKSVITPQLSGDSDINAASAEIMVEPIKPIMDDLTSENLDAIDVPPKPPPRNFVDLAKPIYPADSPKPQVITPKNYAENVPSQQVFEYPDATTGSQTSLVSENVEMQGTLDEKPPKYFEPKTVSTPKFKTDADVESFVYKSIPSYELQKSGVDKKVSPTNSIVKAMIKGKSGKKKNSLVAKRRKISVNDLSSSAEIQGYLFQRLRSRHNQNVHWEKRWFVLLGNSLYGFRVKEDPKAACLIFLSGFTVAVASEVKSRSNAFKVYHTGTVFYFSADDTDSLQSWIDLIRSATLHNSDVKLQETSLYSETDDSDTEKPRTSEKSDSLKKFGSLKKFTCKKNSSETPSPGSTSLDRKWFFNKSSSQAKNSVPVPTAQFRSYRKIKAIPVESSVTTGNFTSHVSLFDSQNLATSQQNVSVPNLALDIVKSEPVVLPNMPKRPSNFIHSSNPSLFNTTDFLSSRSLYKPYPENLSGYLTLEELMLRQTEERKLNPHVIVEEMNRNMKLAKPDVVYGEVPRRQKSLEEETPTSISSKTRTLSLASDKSDSSSSCFGKRLGSLKKNHNKNEDYESSKMSTYPKTAKNLDEKSNRSLPRTHKMLDNNHSYGPSSSSAICMSQLSKERSYEMIYCPETVNDVHYAHQRHLDDTMYCDTPKKNSKIKKQRSFSSTDKKSTKSTSKVQDSSTSKIKLKSAIQYTPMALPLSQDPKSKPKFAFELNLDEKKEKSGKLKQMFSGKSEGKKEKTFLGSPKLHRAIFRRQESGHDVSWPVTPTTQVPLFDTNYFLENAPPIIPEPFAMNISPHVDYPGLEYPPVFEPETYSLANPSNILRKNKNS